MASPSFSTLLSWRQLAPCIGGLAWVVSFTPSMEKRFNHWSLLTAFLGGSKSQRYVLMTRRQHCLEKWPPHTEMLPRTTGRHTSSKSGVSVGALSRKMPILGSWHCLASRSQLDALPVTEFPGTWLRMETEQGGLPGPSLCAP